MLGDFSRALGGWEWDVALLQEVPPWWPVPLARSLDCEQVSVRTSRNALLPLRRFVAVRWPDLIKSNGGGANAILVRADRIVEHRAVRLCRTPERRWAHGVQLAYGIWLVNLHATAHAPDRAQRDVSLAAREARTWAHDLPLVFGGDFNLGAPRLEELRSDGGGDLAGLRSVASSDVDHVLIGTRLRALEPAQTLDRGTLSDHLPLAVTLDVAPG
jgi:endonuclease/exonuclease/phosphatase family metal-dependent hydrolase